MCTTDTDTKFKLNTENFLKKKLLSKKTRQIVLLEDSTRCLFDRPRELVPFNLLCLIDLTQMFSNWFSFISFWRVPVRATSDHCLTLLVIQKQVSNKHSSFRY